MVLPLVQYNDKCITKHGREKEMRSDIGYNIDDAQNATLSERSHLHKMSMLGPSAREASLFKDLFLHVWVFPYMSICAPHACSTSGSQ